MRIKFIDAYFIEILEDIVIVNNIIGKIQKNHISWQHFWLRAPFLLIFRCCITSYNLQCITKNIGVPAEATNLPQGDMLAKLLFIWWVSIIDSTSPEMQQK